MYQIHPVSSHLSLWYMITRAVFVEDAVQTLLSCTKEIGVSSRDVFDTLLPLFTCGSSDVRPTEAYVQPTQVSNDITDHTIYDVDLQDEIYEDMVEN